MADAVKTPEAAPAADDPTIATVAQIAEALGLTPRRVRQLRENGELVTHGRGRIDATHAVNAHVGRRVLGQPAAQVADKFEVAAVGWLVGLSVSGVTAEDVAAWHVAAARWGLSEQQATAALMTAAGRLGDACPKFDARPRKRS